MAAPIQSGTALLCISNFYSTSPYIYVDIDEDAKRYSSFSPLPSLIPHPSSPFRRSVSASTPTQMQGDGEHKPQMSRLCDAEQKPQMPTVCIFIASLYMYVSTTIVLIHFLISLCLTYRRHSPSSLFRHCSASTLMEDEAYASTSLCIYVDKT
ncbi:hypothetical protein B296_00006748 [Ensete ventricosum]|uniref:Uncharacterized protein n=1 Tax=Ensete ventricosum TaxID=4639 RepID=A0A427AB86_ENSVE|nr:hypothetical protein B296_00006748 [Ensete ventricosum]